MIGNKKNVNYFDWAIFNSYVAAMLVITRPGLLRCPIFRQKNSRGVFSSPASKDMRFPLLGSNTSLAVYSRRSTRLPEELYMSKSCVRMHIYVIDDDFVMIYGYLWWFLEDFGGDIDGNQRFGKKNWWTPLVLIFLCDWLANNSATILIFFGRGQFLEHSYDQVCMKMQCSFRSHKYIWGWVKTLVPSEHQNSW